MGIFYLHLTGTNFFEKIVHPDLLSTMNVWDQEIISENKSVYRGSYLAYQMRNSILNGELDHSIEELLKLEPEALSHTVQTFMGPRYSEGYVKGVHDHDGAIILKVLLQIDQNIGFVKIQFGCQSISDGILEPV